MIKVEKTSFEKKIEKQKAFDYCLYMMLTSYFASASCMSKHVETQLLLYYKELKEKLMYEMEEQAINLIEKEILPNIPHYILEKKVQVTLSQNERSQNTRIIINYDNYYFIVTSDYAAKNTKLRMRHCYISKKRL